jgi:hypothetical protein
MNRPIVFLHPWRGREPGQVDTQLDAPIAALLVQRRLARYVDDPPASPAQTSAPSASKREKKRS